MKITSVELHPHGSSEVCELSFRDPSRQNPYNVKGITGLDADEIVPRFYGTPGSSNFYNLVMVKRTIVILLELNPRYELNESPSSLRDNIYRMIASSRQGLMHIWFKEAADTKAILSGYITKTEAPLFNKTSEIQITIECDEPMLKAPNPVSLNVVGLDPSLTIVQDDLSTAPHGFKFEVSFDADVASFLMEDPDDATWAFEITPVAGFDVGDVLHFSSEYNDKYVYIVRGGNVIHLADVIVSGSVWPVIFPGENKFTLANGANLDWDAISHYPTYWGV
jgi:hypothetical protein